MNAERTYDHHQGKEPKGSRRKRLLNGRAAWLAVGFLAGALSLQAQLISVRSELGTDTMMIGDQVRYLLHVDAAANVQFRMPELKDTLNRQIEVISPVSMDTVVDGDRMQVEHAYLITSFEPGDHMVPSIPVEYVFNGNSGTARSMPLMIRVSEPEVDTTQAIKAIKAPINTPLTLKEMLPWILAGLGALLVIALIALLIRRYLRRKKDPESIAMRPSEPAHVVAFRELDALRDQKLWESGRVKEYYTRLTEITRMYIERQYGIPAMERTSLEILEAFRRFNTDDPMLDEMLAGLLQLADLVKFAREAPTPVENQTNLNSAYLFVQKTYPLFYAEEPVDAREDKPEERERELAEMPAEKGEEATDGKS